MSDPMQPNRRITFEALKVPSLVRSVFIGLGWVWKSGNLIHCRNSALVVNM